MNKKEGIKKFNKLFNEENDDSVKPSYYNPIQPLNDAVKKILLFTIAFALIMGIFSMTQVKFKTDVYCSTGDIGLDFQLNNSNSSNHVIKIDGVDNLRCRALVEYEGNVLFLPKLG